MDSTLCARLDSKLRQDPLGNIMALKFLALKGRVAEGGLLEDGQAWASWFHYAPSEVAYDAAMYPDRSRIVYWNANDEGLARRSALNLPEGAVVKVSTEPCLSVAREAWTEGQRFVWLSTDRPVGKTSLGAEVYDVPTDEVAELSRENGYDRAALDEQQTRGCRWYLARSQGLARGLCFVQPNDGKVWEVSGVFVLPEARGQGLAQAVVARAVNDLVAQGRMPRYFVHTANAASLAVARKVGLVERGATVHFLIG